jgi:hypothetical protein
MKGVRTTFSGTPLDEDRRKGCAPDALKNLILTTAGYNKLPTNFVDCRRRSAEMWWDENCDWL